MKKTIYCISVITLIISLAITAFAHGGRTDKNGGHNDNVNGGYHYHCGGHPAHQHPNGVCPYDTAAKTTVKKTTEATTKRAVTTKATTSTTTTVTTETANSVSTTKFFSKITTAPDITEQPDKGTPSGIKFVLGISALAVATAGIAAYVLKKRKK